MSLLAASAAAGCASDSGALTTSIVIADGATSYAPSVSTAPLIGASSDTSSYAAESKMLGATGVTPLTGVSLTPNAPGVASGTR